MTKKRVFVIFVTAMLAGCSAVGGIDPSELTKNRDGNTVSGVAGADWTDQDLRSNAFGVICDQNETVSNLKITRNAGGEGTFSATCVG